MWQTKLSPRTASYEMPPSPGTIDQALCAPKPRVSISNVHLIIAELSGEATGQIRLEIAVVTASVHQVRRPDTDQPLEGAQPKGSLVVPGVLELITIPCTWNIGETAEEAIRFLKTNHPPNSRQVLAYSLRILKAMKVGIAFTL